MIACNPDVGADRVRRAEGILLFIIPTGAAFILPFLWGAADSHTVLREKSRLVRVTIRQDAVQSKTRLPVPKHTLLLGATSSFHFFYECKNDSTAGNASKCEDGWPFIVPTANIASLAFNLQEGEPEVRLSAVITAISELTKTINDLNFSATVNIKEGEVNFDTAQVAEAIIALKSYLEGNTTITNLKETIITLNEAIKGFKRGGLHNPGPDVTATLNALTATLRTLNGTVASLNVIGIQNHCASSLEKIATVGPFPEGKHDRLEKKEKESPKKSAKERLVTPSQLVAKMEEYFVNRQTLQQILLIGRVDSKPLSPEALQFYGMQIKLAQARTRWIQGELLKKFPAQIDPKRITLLSGNYREENKADGRRALDRSVEVWACWTPEPKPDPAGTAAAAVE